MCFDLCYFAIIAFIPMYAKYTIIHSILPCSTKINLCLSLFLPFFHFLCCGKLKRQEFNFSKRAMTHNAHNSSTDFFCTEKMEPNTVFEVLLSHFLKIVALSRHFSFRHENFRAREYFVSN